MLTFLGSPNLSSPLLSSPIRVGATQLSIMNPHQPKGIDTRSTSQYDLPSVRDSGTVQSVMTCSCSRHALFELTRHSGDDLRCLPIHGCRSVPRPDRSRRLHGSAPRVSSSVEGLGAAICGTTTQDHSYTGLPSPKAMKKRRTSSPGSELLTECLTPFAVMGYQQSLTRSLPSENHFQAYQGTDTAPLYEFDDLEEILLSLTIGRYSSSQFPQTDDDSSTGTVDSLVLARNRLR